MLGVIAMTVFVIFALTAGAFAFIGMWLDFRGLAFTGAVMLLTLIAGCLVALGWALVVAWQGVL